MRLICLSLLSALPATSGIHAPPQIFHGTSVIIQPSTGATSPANSTITTANFFCYMTNQGYISFGWWVSPSLNSNTSHYKADSDAYHWYEYSKLDTCDQDAGTCTFLTQNFLVRNSADDGVDPLPFPSRPLTYVVRPLDIGNGDYGRIAQSYIDDGQLQVYAVGTRQLLSGEQVESDECRKALGTLQRVQKLYEPKLGFEIVDTCAQRSLSNSARFRKQLGGW
ncbi:uncharacterized protein K460DRAFT_395950 [Cucurbitaria berberidis CBS 394.84]|uniref:Ecp2 effector protein domain-containing protein n=1 Tax=Cucurbitaria berberidis CBS 394.84 TaxID=1168544 RepID=A0A9P4GI41_9PLEO|nr:uncharacterized protein K460DRAFT_395950 [Cucurbitaria berberidis CBS 394.84]KAF1846588.1 hypothetical protein K460DRAFT_395950 [Cucurbitaria berberidis CBS 394.84]